jgi:tetratricopeptide (TPR) repeat protein
MGRHVSFLHRILETDLPAVVESGTLTIPAAGRRQRRHRALFTVLEAFSRSGKADRTGASTLLEKSVSLYPDLKLQSLCRIWLCWLDTCGAAGADDDTADTARDEINAVKTDLRPLPGRNGLLERVFQPVRHADRLLAARWIDYFLFGVEVRRASVTEPVMLACEKTWRNLRQRTAAKDALDRLWIRMRHRYAVRRGDDGDADRTARAWALLCRDDLPRDAASLMLQNLQRLETKAAAGEDDTEPDALLRLCQSYLEILPDDYDLLVAQARATRRAGQFEACRDLCTRAIEIRPDAYPAYSVRSNLFFLLEEYTHALQDAEQACRIAPDQPHGFIARGFVQLQLGEYEKALQDFDRALALDAQRLDAMHGRGKCLSLLGEDREAMACFNRLRRLLPQDPDIAYELADAMFAAGFLEDCLRVCGECIALDPSFTEAHVLMAVVETRRENDGRAFDHL